MDSPEAAPKTATLAEPVYREAEPFELTAQGQKLTFYAGGKARFDKLIALIENAQRSIRIAFYIFAPDASGIRVRDALIAAASRGVEVNLIVDGFGARVDEAFFAELEEAGGCFCLFIPQWSVRFLIRNHQKIVLIDEEIAMLGGFNVEDEYFVPPEQGGWSDLGFTVEGSLVERITVWFGELSEWTQNPKAQFREIRRLVREWDSGLGSVRLLIGGPLRGLSSWSRSVSRDLIRGEQLDMVMAYFTPSFRLRRRIRRIAAKGRTRIVLAGKSDNAATIGASRALYGGLLRAGARIFEFQPRKLHTKLIVLDDAVYIGSANFDMRSLYLNLEIVVRIEDRALADRMREFVGRHIPACLEVTGELHKSRATVWNRVRWWASWFLVSVVDYTVSRRLNLGL